MSKVYKFSKKDKNRYRKVYRYIRKKPVFEYCSSSEFELVSGFVEFENTAGPVTYTFPSTVSFQLDPVATVTSVDSLSNNSADVNAFISSINASSISISVSVPFSGRVHFIVIGQD